MPNKRTDEDIQIRKVMANRLWSVLEDQEITESELCEISGVSKSIVKSLLYEKSSTSVLNVIKISKALMVSMDYICGISDEM